MTEKKIAIASDHAGFEMKQMLCKFLQSTGSEPVDLGAHDTQSVDYPDYANAMAKWMADNTGGSGILICGSGIGISIAANRHKHIRAALVSSPVQAMLSRQHNNANVLCLGARFMDAATAKTCTEKFLTTEFEGGRHQKRVEKL